MHIRFGDCIFIAEREFHLKKEVFSRNSVKNSVCNPSKQASKTIMDWWTTILMHLTQKFFGVVLNDCLRQLSKYGTLTTVLHYLVAVRAPNFGVQRISEFTQIYRCDDDDWSADNVAFFAIEFFFRASKLWIRKSAIKLSFEAFVYSETSNSCTSMWLLKYNVRLL